MAFFAVVSVACSGVVAADGTPVLRVDDEAGDRGDVDDVVVVRFTPPPSGVAEVEDLRRHAEESQRAFVEHVKGRDDVDVVRRFWISNSVLVEADPEVVEELEDLPEVVGLHPNYRYRLAQADVVRDEGEPREIGHVRRGHGYTVDYGVEAVNATAVWNDTMGDGVKVAVLDTGVDPSHPDVDLYTEDVTDPRSPGGWSEFDSRGMAVDGEPYDAGLHGTHVSGKVVGGDGSGVWIGVAPEAELLHSKVFDVGGTFAQINAGMQWAVEQDADVLSLSFGVSCTGEEGSRYVRPMVEPVVNAEASGTFVVAAAGNGGEGCTSSPSNVPEAYAVGAVDRFLEVPSFSGGGEVNTSEAWGDVARENWSESYVVPDAVAPGVDVVSAVPDGGYRGMDGTSMAAPHVAGAAALVQSASEQRLEPGDIREALEESSRKPDDAPSEKDVRYGDGVVDVYRAVEHVKAQEEEEDDGGGDETDDADVNETDGSDSNGTGDGSDDMPEDLPGMGFAAAVAALAGLVVLRRKT